MNYFDLIVIYHWVVRLLRIPKRNDAALSGSLSPHHFESNRSRNPLHLNCQEAARWLTTNGVLCFVDIAIQSIVPA